MLATKTREAFEKTRLFENHLFKLWRKILNQGMAGKCCARNFFIQPFSHPHQIQTVDPFMNTTSTYHFRSSMVLHHWYNKTCYRNRSRDVSSPQGFFFPINPWIFFFSSIQYNILSFSFLIFQFPLMSESRKLRDLRTEQETNTSTVQPRTTEEEQENSDGYEIEENSVT